MVKGSAWMTASNIISRMLGGDLHHPLVRLDGRARKRSEQFVFNGGYTIYALFLTYLTAGIPGAIAKWTSHYK